MYTIVVAIDRTGDVVGAIDPSDFKGNDQPYPYGWKELLDKGISFDQVDLDCVNEEQARAIINRHNPNEFHPSWSCVREEHPTKENGFIHAKEYYLGFEDKYGSHIGVTITFYDDKEHNVLNCGGDVYLEVFDNPTNPEAGKSQVVTANFDIKVEEAKRMIGLC